MLHLSSVFCVNAVLYLLVDDVWQNFVSMIYMVPESNCYFPMDVKVWALT